MSEKVHFPRWGWVLTALVIVIGIVSAINSSPARQAQRAAQEASDTAAKQAREAHFQLALGGALTLRGRMRNPDTFKISSAIVMPDNTVCYEYRSQNGFGGMGNGRAMLYAGILLSPALEEHHSKLWEMKCVGQSGYELVDDMNSGLSEYDKLHGIDR